MNDFATGLLAAGPNVFLDCEAVGSLGASGAFEGWASGVLYEGVKVPNARIELLLDQTRAQGAGWTAANSVVWNSTAQSVDVMGPPGAPNFVVTAAGSLYGAQMAARGLAVAEPREKRGVERAVADFRGGASGGKAAEGEGPKNEFEIVGGRMVIDGKVAWGGTAADTWWRGNTSPGVAGRLTGTSVTRFMPGQVGPGLTEDLPELAERLKALGTVFYQMIPGLWYEHRRDEHTVTRQVNGDVWAPFYEMPWARSGKGKAWDGLSRFDLSRYNPWYFARQREFAKLAAAKGIVVIQHVYNNHNVLEIGPHWIDYPWRPANNVNDTGLPEPPPFVADARKIDEAARAYVDELRLNVGNEFYSTSYEPRRKLHHDFIFHVLDELGDLPNVIFTVAYQYAGPLEFEQFFQDTVAEWERLHGRRVRIALITSKGNTDAILADPVRGRQVAMVDMRYWQYRPDGRLWAPGAGVDWSYRQQIMEESVLQGFKGWTGTPPPSTAEQVYRQVREYRDRYPEVALLPMESGAGPMPILMAGAASPSSVRIPAVAPVSVPTVNPQVDRRGPALDGAADKLIREMLADDLMKMSPRDGVVEGAWVLADEGMATVLIDARGGGATIALTGLPGGRGYRGAWIDPEAAGARGGEVVVRGGASVEKPDGREWLLLLRAER